ncbi:thiamine-phosphate kinase [Segnochrobactrum spirostomi]|uniref:Thiamine-monophosphate kinase n=1 Tax=Segnochrobactrum spirostomi TaxID=2608987 RepID=A0A6A7Y5R8_9HYPH|nr:thiamine-phosphate kinase [Segnochrobactrum spirostomi]MQT13697.1 thiamine-phosphate kinase [Segnochrobactrum spirostomi]
MGDTRPTEVELIARYLAPLATDPGADRLTDDAAVMPADPDHDLVVTTDALAAGIHFFADDPPDAIARKALRVNLSDLAAKGAAPRGYLLTLALPADWREDWLAAFVGGLAADQAEFACPLLGGDTLRAPSGLVVSVTAFGTVEKGGAVRRGHAQAGDRLFVTGTIGDAALGLKLRLDPASEARWGLSSAEAEHLHDRYLLPRPRVPAAEAVRRFARAAMDVSDGLVGDLDRLCRASGVGATLHAAAVPQSPAAHRAVAADADALRTVLTGGDDYEILATVAPERADAFSAACAAAGVPATEIGRIETAGAPLRVINADGNVLSLGSGRFEHF